MEKVRERKESEGKKEKVSELLGGAKEGRGSMREGEK